MRVCARIYVCATCLWVCFGACVFVCVRVCVINVGVYLCGPVMVCLLFKCRESQRDSIFPCWKEDLLRSEGLFLKTEVNEAIKLISLRR